MNDPYSVLDLPRDAGEAQIRRQYLQLVKQFPPERAAHKFAEIRAAYDALRDPVVRLQKQLFDVDAAQTLDELASQRQTDVREKRLPTGLLLSLGQ